MSQLLSMMVSLINSVTFAQMKHPMNMGILLLIQTVLMCLVTGSMGQSLWFSYILFLVFLGGMLVLFIYMTSVASNEIFKKTNYMVLTIITPVILIMMALTVIMIDPNMLVNNTLEMMPLMESCKIEKGSMLMMMFNMPNNTMTIFMVLYLFLTLIVIVSITETHQGPLRSKS